MKRHTIQGTRTPTSMRVFWGILFGTFFFCQMSCNSQKQVVTAQNTDNDPRIKLIDEDLYSGIYQLETSVVRDMKSLKKFYAQINKTRKPGLPVPSVDFSQHTALIICAGAQEADEKVGISFGDENDKELIINIKKHSVAESTANGTSTITYPFYVYTIPSTMKSVHFVKLK